MDCCGASLRRSLAGNSDGTRSGRRLAGRAEASRKHDRQITNSWLLVREVYLYKIPELVAAQRRFRWKQVLHIRRSLGKPRESLVDSTVAWRSHNGVSDTG